MALNKAKMNARRQDRESQRDLQSAREGLGGQLPIIGRLMELSGTAEARTQGLEQLGRDYKATGNRAADDVLKYVDVLADYAREGGDEADDRWAHLRQEYRDITQPIIESTQRGVLDDRPRYGEEMRRAGAEVSQAHEGTRGQLQRQAAARGLNALQTLGAQREMGLGRAQDIATARNNARRAERARAEDATRFNFQTRLAGADLKRAEMDLIRGQDSAFQDSLSGLSAAVSGATNAGNLRLAGLHGARGVEQDISQNLDRAAGYATSASGAQQQMASGFAGLADMSGRRAEAALGRGHSTRMHNASIPDMSGIPQADLAANAGKPWVADTYTRRQKGLVDAYKKAYESQRI